MNCLDLYHSINIYTNLYHELITHKIYLKTLKFFIERGPQNILKHLFMEIAYYF